MALILLSKIVCKTALSFVEVMIPAFTL